MICSHHENELTRSHVDDNGAGLHEIENGNSIKISAAVMRGSSATVPDSLFVSLSLISVGASAARPLLILSMFASPPSGVHA